MKRWFLDNSLKIIKDNNSNFDDEKIDSIRYGLEATYLSLSKVIVIMTINYFLGMFNEALILLLLFNVLRLTGFGLHASKSWICWITSSITFIGVPFLCRTLIIPNAIVYVTSLFCLVCFLLYAPADTIKRPLINKVSRLKYKILTLCTAVIYVLALLYVKDNFIINSILFSMIIETILIHPFSYRLFNLPYKNYERYVLND